MCEWRGRGRGLGSRDWLARLGVVLKFRGRLGSRPLALDVRLRRVVETVAVVGCAGGFRRDCRQCFARRTSRARITRTASAPATASSATPTTPLATLGALAMRIARDYWLARSRHRTRCGLIAMHGLVSWLHVAAMTSGSALGAALRAAFGVTAALVAPAIPTMIAIAVTITVVTAATVAAIAPGAIRIT
jgi:hypothetical protein